MHKKYLKGYTNNNTVQLVRGGRQYFDLLIQLIRQASFSIHLQVYIFADDDTGREVVDALANAAKRGVQVYLMADGYASQGLPKAFIRKINDAGIRFRFFEPFFRSKYFYFGRRLHHKVFVADNVHALVGGLNIANRYNDFPGKPAWLDFAAYVKGTVVQELCVLCSKTWNGFLPVVQENIPCAANEKFYAPKDKDCLVRMRRNDWVRKKNQVARSYAELLITAQHNLTILCSYFLPGIAVTKRLIAAAKRGVKVKIIMAGTSDVILVKHAERYIYDKLINNGIEVFEYLPNVLHGKVAVCDDEWMTIGSYNVNNLSAYASIELNLDIRNQQLSRQMCSTLEDIISRDCIEITPDYFSKHNTLWHRLVRWVSYQTLSLVFYLITFYYRQRD